MGFHKWRNYESCSSDSGLMDWRSVSNWTAASTEVGRRGVSSIPKSKSSAATPAGSELFDQVRAPLTRVTSLDVSREAGVSQSAVSRAFTPGGKISAATRQRVMLAAQKLGYQPNALARSLATQRSGIVALIVGELQNPFYPQALTQLAQALETRGKRALLITHDPARELQETLDAARSYQIEAAIVFPTRLNSGQLPRQAPSLDVPVLFFNRRLSGLNVLSVTCDNYAGGVLAAELLLRAGARQLAFVGGDPDTSTHRDRLSGFSERLSHAGVELLGSPAQWFTYEWGFQATLDLHGVGKHRAGKLPDGIFAANDIIAFGVLDALRQLGRAVPNEVSVIGFDDIQEAGWQAYQLTTIRQPLRAMIQDTLSVLDDPPSSPGSARLHPPHVIWRSTVAGQPPEGEV